MFVIIISLLGALFSLYIVSKLNYALKHKPTYTIKDKLREKALIFFTWCFIISIVCLVLSLFLAFAN